LAWTVGHTQRLKAKTGFSRYFKIDWKPFDGMLKDFTLYHGSYPYQPRSFDLAPLNDPTNNLEKHARLLLGLYRVMILSLPVRCNTILTSWSRMLRVDDQS
jgi:hypothetical protein